MQKTLFIKWDETIQLLFLCDIKTVILLEYRNFRVFEISINYCGSLSGYLLQVKNTTITLYFVHFENKQIAIFLCLKPKHKHKRTWKKALGTIFTWKHFRVIKSTKKIWRAIFPAQNKPKAWLVRRFLIYVSLTVFLSFCLSAFLSFCVCFSVSLSFYS